jgi:VIT1/CCC1 family predicted Fe2+/Mn2+ transporter
MRRHLPESPRWLIMHGREAEAEENIRIIEHEAEKSGQRLAPVDETKAIEIKPAKAHGLDKEDAPLYLIAFALGNLIGPLTIGHLFDVIGRRKMIAGTYLLSGVLLAITAFLLNAGVLNAITQAIAVFFAIAQCFGAIGPVFYGYLIGEGDTTKLLIGYLIGAGVMIIGGIVEIFLGIDAEGESLEDVAAPLSAVTSRPRATG